jgi:hypothetical protein
MAPTVASLERGSAPGGCGLVGAVAARLFFNGDISFASEE